MMSLNDPLSMKILDYDGKKQRKSIPEKFKRKEFHSLAVDNQKIKKSDLSFPGLSLDKENMKPNMH